MGLDKYTHHTASQVALVLKNPPASARDSRDVVQSLGGSGRAPEEEHGTTVLARKIQWDGRSYGQNPWGHEESRTPLKVVLQLSS